MKKILIVIMVNLLLIEVLSIGFVYAIGIFRPGLHFTKRIERHLATITDEDFRLLRERYDGLVGWGNKPYSRQEFENSAGVVTTASFGPDGAREDGQDHGQVLINTYGDSFTQCHEVDNDQTWQFFLEQMVSADVKNFGVNGYGAAQTLLKAIRHFEEGVVAKHTMFVIYTDALDRAVNNFRPFNNSETRGKLAFKPSFRQIDGAVRLVPMAFDDPSMSDDEILSLVWRQAEDDYWMSTRLCFKPRFPYSFEIAKTLPRLTRVILHKFGSEQPRLWDLPEGRAVMLHILREFKSAAETVGTTPIVVFIPNVHRWKNGRLPTVYHRFKTEALEKELPDLTTIDVADAEFDEERFNVVPFTGHVSEYGNRRIAAHLAMFLRELGMLD